MQEWQHLATDLECSTYEDQYARNVENYVAANTDDPDKDEMLFIVRSWHEHFIRFGRSTLGSVSISFGRIRSDGSLGPAWPAMRL